MNPDKQPTALKTAITHGRRVLGPTAWSTATLAGVVLLGRSSAIVRTDDEQALVGSWLVAATPSGAQSGPPRLVSFTGDGVALRTAPLQQAAPPALARIRQHWQVSRNVTYSRRPGDADPSRTIRIVFPPRARE